MMETFDILKMTSERLSQGVQIGQQQDELFQEFLRSIREQKLLVAGDFVVVAVSGGMDSSVLAYLLAKAAKILDVRVALAHVDHRTRGETSQHEQEWVRALAAKLRIPFHALRVPEEIVLNQNEFRNHRRRLLLDLAKIIGAQKIATAHHADDNAETFIMRSISGSGIHGLRGMAPLDGPWVKPLLRFSRQNLMAFARSNAISWVEDSTNARGQYLRNRIRNEFFPLLEEIRQSSVTNLSLVAERVWEEEEELAEWLGQQLSELPPRTLPMGWLEKWPRTLQRRIFRSWLTSNQLEPNPNLIENLLAGREVVHTQGIILKHSDHWIFYPENDFGSRWASVIDLELNRRSFLGSSLAWSFLPKAQDKFKVYDLSIYLCQRSPSPKENINSCLDWESLPRDLVIRRIRREDAPEVHSKIEAAKLPRSFGRVWPVLSSRQRPEDVYAVIGLGVIEAFQYSRRGPCLVMETFLEPGIVNS